MIITCSNDEKLKIWGADLELIETLYGHSAFVFSVKALRLGSYISGGEDRVLKLWSETTCVQEVHLPCSIWSVVYDENSDIFTAGSDGFIRVFTTD
jgi:phospholipase A-2-activating protein